MQPYAIWFLLGLVVLGLELATGTFYMLVLAVALGAGGLAALAGVPGPAQFAVAAVVGVAGVIVLQRWKARQAQRPQPSQDLDAGQPVQVLAWREDGTVRVRYRGTEWDAGLVSPDMQRSAVLYIAEVRGVRLVLTDQKP